MRAAVFSGPRSIEVAGRPDPVVAAPTDAVVRVVLACVCGSDLGYYWGESPHALGPIGQEFVGVVDQVGVEVQDIAEGDLMVAPFKFSDGTCANCRAGWTSSCLAGGAFGTDGFDGGQGQALLVPFADATLVVVPGSGHSDETMASVMALSDVMPTGHHAALSAGVVSGSVVAVVGDGAVGLCAVIAAGRLGAALVIALTRNPPRQALARSFGASDIVAERGDAATEAVLELTDGVGVDAALECVGTAQSFATAFTVARPGATVGSSGFPTASRFRSTLCSPATSGCAAAVRPCAPTSLSSSTTSWRVASSPAASSTSRPTSTASRKRTPPRTSGARSNR